MIFQSLINRIGESFSIIRFLTLINVILVGTIAWIAGDVAALFVEHEMLQVPYKEAKFNPPENKIRDKALKFSDFQDILAFNVFNAEVASAIMEQFSEPDEQINPGARLNSLMQDFSLSGINYRRDHYIYAIIGSKKERREDIFTIGDELFETGASVKRIFTDYENQRVLLQLGNETGLLRYKVEDEKNAKPGSKKKTTPRKIKNPKSTLNSNYTNDGKTFYISATEVDSHLNDFGSLLNQARMVP
jgi:hypothetical protein